MPGLDPEAIPDEKRREEEGEGSLLEISAR